VGGGAAGAYGQRWGKGDVVREGGSAATESAVRKNLVWLRRHQSSDGRWDADGWTANCTGTESCGDLGVVVDTSNDVGLTSLSLLAFLGTGHSHRFGVYKRSVRLGLRWLKRQQGPDGSFGDRQSVSHALATLALCEAYAVSRDFTLKRYTQKATALCVAWTLDLNVWTSESDRRSALELAWLILALQAAKTAGLDVPPAAFERVRVALAARNRDSNSASWIATTVIGGLFAGEKRSTEWIRAGAQALRKDHLPAWTPNAQVDLHAWHLTGLAMFQVGGPGWREWNASMQEALLPAQRMSGCQDGSWDPVGEQSVLGGRVAATALASLTLEVYCRYERSKGH
jgi:hypothetical protein